MSKYMVWKCDRCGEQKISEAGPKDWVSGHVAPIDSHPIWMTDFNWCENCWMKIKGPSLATRSERL